MVFFAGMDLGAHNLRFFYANENGEIELFDPVTSPFRKTKRKHTDGSDQVHLDTIMTNVPENERVSRYLSEMQDQFFSKSGKGLKDFEAQGAQMAGKVWQREGKWYLMGSNTPTRFAVQDPEGQNGILIDTSFAERFKGANDGNAAAKAQSIYYQVKLGLAPSTTGYIILGGGFGFGVPDTETQTEGGHVEVGFIHPALLRKCGDNAKVVVGHAENYASGPGQVATVVQVIEYFDAGIQGPIASLAAHEKEAGRIGDLVGAIEASPLYETGNYESKDIMDAAHSGDKFASWIVDLAAEAVKVVCVGGAQFYGLQRIGIGESVAEGHPWFVDKVANRVTACTKGNTLLQNGLTVELTPIKDAGKYGALSLVVPSKLYSKWADVMKADR